MEELKINKRGIYSKEFYGKEMRIFNLEYVHLWLMISAGKADDHRELTDYENFDICTSI